MVGWVDDWVWRTKVTIEKRRGRKCLGGNVQGARG
jgi:hypothetical protein